MLEHSHLQRSVSEFPPSEQSALRTFKVCHVRPHVRVESIHHHLPIRWPGDLHPSIHQAWCRRRSFPGGIVSNVLGLWQKVWQNALVKFSLSDRSTFKESLSCGIEGAVEECQERGSFLGEDDLLALID